MLEFLDRYLRPRWRHVLVLAALVFGNEGLDLFEPQIVRFFIDTAREGGALDTLLRTGGLFLGIVLLHQAVSVVESSVAANLGWSATNALRADLAAHCLRLDMAFHNAKTPGELIERVDGDVGALRNFFSRFVVLMIGGALFLVGVLALLFREDWRLATFITAMSGLSLGVLVWRQRWMVPRVIASRQASADVFGFVEERLGGLPDIQGNGLQTHTVNRLEGELRRWFGASRRTIVAGMALGTISGLVGLVAIAGTLAGVAWLFAQGGISLGTAYLLVHYAKEAQDTTRQIARQIETYQLAAASLTRIRELESLRPVVQDSRSPRVLPPGPLSVDFDDVSFAYGGEPTVRDITFHLPPGRTLGILGRTGGGKTTLTRLLFRLYDVMAGAVRVGGVDVRDIPLAQLHRRIAMVTQEVQLFRATVRDNVALFDRSISDARIEGALEAVGLGPWLSALVQGLDTILESGGGLSAGEAQLLAFARVFLRDPSVVVLDEASSRLDPATERLVERAVGRLLADRTAIVIAHRLRTLDRADDVLIVEGGRAIEHGRRAALAADPRSRFAEILRVGLPTGAARVEVPA